MTAILLLITTEMADESSMAQVSRTSAQYLLYIKVKLNQRTE